MCYGREELLYLNMVRQGVIGEILHGEAAYIHDLRDQMKQVERGTGSWRTYHYIEAQREPLPVPRPRPGGAVHEPRAHRGHLRPASSSFSSPSRVRALLREGELPAPITSGTRRSSSPATSTRRSSRPRSAGRSWSSGTSSPRGPYSRHNLIAGTKGVLAGFPNRLAIEGVEQLPRVDRGRGVGEVRRAVRAPALQAHRRARQEDGRPRRHGLHRAVPHGRVPRRTACRSIRTSTKACFWSSVGPLEREVGAGGRRAAGVPGLHAGQLEDDEAAGHHRLSVGMARLSPGRVEGSYVRACVDQTSAAIAG
ncbi:MAG: hypothetical protein MZW92_40430 [Comamonadaceae bacterium]|nr:hypothetical protein [Comamonadaceae bacterium]